MGGTGKNPPFSCLRPLGNSNNGLDVELSVPDGLNADPKIGGLSDSTSAAPERPRLVGMTKGSPARHLLVFWFGPVAYSAPIWCGAPRGDGMRFAGTPWLCAARTNPQRIFCYRTVNGVAESPFLLLYPNKRLVEIETLGAPMLLSSRTKPRAYDYKFAW